jgi:DNA-directed RNA polymerase subunit M/transcription elongation factor TFIIS
MAQVTNVAARVAVLERLAASLEAGGAADPLRYAVRLEASIELGAGGDPARYGRSAYAALARLAVNAAWIAANIPPHELPETPWRRQCTGLAIIQHEVDEADETARFGSLLVDNVESVKARTCKIDRGIACRACKSNDVAITMRQTCSADEGMSGLALCRGCGARWTFR